MPTKLKNLVITKVDLCKAGADPDATIEIFKSRTIVDPIDPPPVKKENTSVSKIQKPEDFAKAKPEEIQAYVDSLEKQLTDTSEELEKAKKKKPVPPANDNDADDNDGGNPFAKALPEAVQKRLDEQAVEIKKANDRADNAEKIAKANEARAELVELESSVAKTMPNIPGTVTEVAKLLQEAKAVLTAPSFVVLEKALKAGSEAIAKSTQEIGSNHGPVIGSAQEEITKRADQMVEQKICKTRPEAITRIAKEDADLYNRYRAETLPARRIA